MMTGMSDEHTITLSLTDREADYLVAATNEFYQKMKASAEDTTFGAMITSERVLVARSLWLKAEKEIGTGEW